MYPYTFNAEKKSPGYPLVNNKTHHTIQLLDYNDTFIKQLNESQNHQLKIWMKKYYGDNKLSCRGFAYFIMKSNQKEDNYYDNEIDLDLDLTSSLWSVRLYNLEQKRLELLEKIEFPYIISFEKGNHFALRLEENLYLSQWGMGGDIVLSDLDAMQCFYTTDEIGDLVTIMVPNPNGLNPSLMIKEFEDKTDKKKHIKKNN